MERIPMSDLKDGYLYEIDARNQSRGIWLEDEKGFEIARKKFERIYLFVEYDYETGAPFGTATPYTEIEKVPEDILLDADKRLKYLRTFNFPTERQKYKYATDVWYKRFVDISGYDFTRENWK